MIQRRLDFLPFSVSIGTLQQDRTTSQNCGFRDLDSLEQSPRVSFVQSGFVFQLPLGNGLPEGDSWDAITCLLTVTATG